MGNSPTRDDATTELPPPGRLRKRTGSIWLRVLFALVLGLAMLLGVWFLGARPSLQHDTVMQIDRDWNQAISDALADLSTVPPGPRNILLSEKSINTALNFYHTAQSPDWQVTATPANIRVSFTGCDQHCSFIAFLEVSSYGHIQVTQTQVQGLLAPIMSNDELTNALNNHLQQLFIVRITKVMLLEHAIFIQLR